MLLGARQALRRKAVDVLEFEWKFGRGRMAGGLSFRGVVSALEDASYRCYWQLVGGCLAPALSPCDDMEAVPSDGANLVCGHGEVLDALARLSARCERCAPDIRVGGTYVCRVP